MSPTRKFAAPLPSLHPLTTPEQFEEILASSYSRPVIVFKHSFTCGTSAQAHEDLADYLSTQGPFGDAEWYLVDVRAQALARLLADRLGIRHESPQILLIVSGQVRWHASHYRVTGAAIHAALAGLTAA